MPKFLIEVKHSDEIYACAQAIKVFLESGSHYLVNADWGCADNIHKSWFTLEAENREQALMVVPPAFRESAHAILLTKFSLPEIDDIIRHHRP